MSSLNLTHSIPAPTLSQANSRSNHLTNRGFFFHQARDYAQALDFYQQAITMNPQNARAYYLTGQIHQLLQDFPHATTAYEHAIIIDPSFLSPIAALARLALDTFDWPLFHDVLNQIPGQLAPYTISPEMYQLLQIHQPTLFTTLKVQANWDELIAYQIKPHLSYFAKLTSPTRQDNNKIRLGYLSSQFHFSHTGRQLLQLIHSHNPEIFHTTAISIGPKCCSHPNPVPRSLFSCILPTSHQYYCRLRSGHTHQISSPQSHLVSYYPSPHPSKKHYQHTCSSREYRLLLASLTRSS